ncbi:MAG: thioredoxin domain-containing protein [Saprospiraceae bacterium]
MNRLQHESSPYLLQHAHNPVDWYAWKPEAFERARAEQKPILVSIGYSTCHWCHVMERESFENEGVAAFMNEHFINIKVDREERPDVDAIYMEACQLLTGGGGWPLNCFLTPDAKPFYAGTYFPPRSMYNRPGWLQLLEHLANIWETKRDTAIDQAERLLANIQRNDGIFIGTQQSPQTLNFEALFSRMRTQFDHSEGGFGGAPKFPSTMALQWLLNWHYFSGNPEALEHALFSLDKMARGGIYDQIGGGFARYATDREWLIPHFEKMLYDNALLVSVLSETHKIVGSGPRPTVNSQWSAIIEQTLAYIAREMTNPEGGFYSAQDADSEGVEGKFFVWDKSEIEAILGEDAGLFCQFYGVTEAGNWEEKNILWRPYNFEAFAADHNIKVEELQKRLNASSEKLLARRSQRIWPGLDNKMLLGWNALMTSAYVAAFTALGHEEYRQAAVRNLHFLLGNFQNQPLTTHHSPITSHQSWRHSAAQPFAFLDDYAYLIAALVDVYQISFDPRYLQLAGECTEYVFKHFHDPESNMFFFTDIDQTDILFRKKDLYDNATPSGNSTMVHNLQRLGILLDRLEWRNAASEMLLAMRETVEKYPLSFERWAMAMLNEVYPIYEIAIIGENAIEKALDIQRRFLPNKVISASTAPNDTLPLLAGKPGAADALIYVCRDFACQRPVSTLEEFWELVNS